MDEDNPDKKTSGEHAYPPIRKKNLPVLPIPKNLRPHLLNSFDLKYFDDLNIPDQETLAICRDYSLEEIKKLVDEVYQVDPSSWPSVSIITPLIQGLDLIKNCWQGLCNHTHYPNWEWIVGVDKSTHKNILEYLNTLPVQKVKVVLAAVNHTDLHSVKNDLAAHARGKYLAFFSQDNEPQDFWLSELLSKLIHRKDIGGVSCKVIAPDGKVQHAGIAFGTQGPEILSHQTLQEYEFQKNFENYDRYFQACTTDCFLIKKKDFEKVGGFSLAYHNYLEDVDLCLRIRDTLKKKIFYAANVNVKATATAKKGIKQEKNERPLSHALEPQLHIDLPEFKDDIWKDVCKVDFSVVTCVNDIQEYTDHVIGSLLRNNTKKNYELIPIINKGNPYSAAEALNIGIEQARGEIIMMPHQDIIMYKNFINQFYECIHKIEKEDKNWGVVGTAGLTEFGLVTGIVHEGWENRNFWMGTVMKMVYPVQTVDEHFLAIRKASGLKFDSRTADGFHIYGPDICLNAMYNKNMRNYGLTILLNHHSRGGSRLTGSEEVLRQAERLKTKWGHIYQYIRTSVFKIEDNAITIFALNASS